MSLEKLQASIFKAIVGTSNDAETVKGLIKDNPPLSVLERLDIYRDAYVIRISGALSSDFGGFSELIGAELFDDLLEKFCSLAPSRFSNLAELSHTFVEFLKNDLRLTTAQIEMAEIEFLVAKSKAIA